MNKFYMLPSEHTPTNPFDSELGFTQRESKINLKQVVLEIQKFGLTKTQSEVFTYLGKFGAKSSPEIYKALKLPRTETYGILKELIRMGIVMAQFGHPTKYGIVSFPKALSTIVKSAQERVNELARKEAEVLELWNKVPTYSDDDTTINSEKFQIIHGTARIYSKMKTMVKETREECKILGSDKDISRFYYSDFIEILASTTKRFRMIISPSYKLPSFVKTIDHENVRLLPHKISKQCFLVKDASEVLIFLRNFNFSSNNTLALWTDASSIIQSMFMLFDYSWNNSLPIDYDRYLN